MHLIDQTGKFEEPQTEISFPEPILYNIYKLVFPQTELKLPMLNVVTIFATKLELVDIRLTYLKSMFPSTMQNNGLVFV